MLERFIMFRRNGMFLFSRWPNLNLIKKTFADWRPRILVFCVCCNWQDLSVFPSQYLAGNFLSQISATISTDTKAWPSKGQCLEAKSTKLVRICLEKWTWLNWWFLRFFCWHIHYKVILICLDMQRSTISMARPLILSDFRFIYMELKTFEILINSFNID